MSLPHIIVLLLTKRRGLHCTVSECFLNKEQNRLFRPDRICGVTIFFIVWIEDYLIMLLVTFIDSWCAVVIEEIEKSSPLVVNWIKGLSWMICAFFFCEELCRPWSFIPSVVLSMPILTDFWDREPFVFNANFTDKTPTFWHSWRHVFEYINSNLLDSGIAIVKCEENPVYLSSVSSSRAATAAIVRNGILIVGIEYACLWLEDAHGPS